ncbi:hypothetical protein NLU13_2506 [Sarocladium strictum]|uniref:Minor extracellular protease vpr n=1 Tax=Sarocladium strictum TaxID=5046 RepID=A0AA39GM35_SARSR|nr:hypothetical protein NLU13_2506 [Sarocladium strictum]
MKVSTLLATALATSTSLVSAEHARPKSSGRGVVPGAYILELESAEDTAQVSSDVQNHGTVRMELNYKLFKGVSVVLNDVEKADETVMKIAEANPAVKNVWPLQTYSIPKPKVEWIGKPNFQSSDLKKRQDGSNGTVESFAPHVMTQIDKLHEKGVKGKGIKIAVIDTGIDYTHPALGNGCFGKGCIVVEGHDFVGDNYTGSNTPVPDNDPMDCGGHGTHVAGIVAARENQYGFIGAAPEASLAAYRVFGCSGSAGNDVLIAAYNRAFEDGADIITASIGGPSGWSEEPWAVAVSRIVEQGVPCPVSAGNDGSTGQFFASTASNGKGIISVASIDSTVTPSLLTVSSFTVDGGKSADFGYTPAEPAAWADVKLPLWSVSKDLADPKAGCDPYPDNTPDLSDRIVLIRRGSCTFVQKAQNAAAKGARYIMFWNNVPVGSLATDISTVPGILAGGMVSADVGSGWLKALNAGSEVVLDMVDPEDPNAKVSLSEVPNNVTGGALSTFTSWGPTFEGDNKPQIGSPGGNILSTYPVAKGSYAVLSGTSMACPLVAGTLALLAEVRGTFNSKDLEDLLSANANPQLFNDGTAFYEFLAPVQQQGGGLIQAYDAAYATVILSPSSLAFNDTDHANKVLNFTLKNTGKEELTFDISNVPSPSWYTLAQDEPYPIAGIPEPADESASLEFSEAKVSVGAGEEVTIEVIPSPPKGLVSSRLPVWSGFIAVNGSDGTSLSLPYQGIAASLHEASVLLGDNYTWIANSTDPNSAPVAANTTFTIPKPGSVIVPSKDVLPAFALDMALGSPFARVYVTPLTTCPPNRTEEYKGHKVLGEIQGSPFQYLPRSLNALPWNGILADGEAAPPGKYQFVIEALHIFGDSSDKDDKWDMAKSPSFRIKYKE